MRSGSPARRRLTPALLVMAMVAALLPLGQAATAATNSAIQFNGTTQYATLGTQRTIALSPNSRLSVVQKDRHRNHHRWIWDGYRVAFLRPSSLWSRRAVRRPRLRQRTSTTSSGSTRRRTSSWLTSRRHRSRRAGRPPASTTPSPETRSSHRTSGTTLPPHTTGRVRNLYLDGSMTAPSTSIVSRTPRHPSITSVGTCASTRVRRSRRTDSSKGRWTRCVSGTSLGPLGRSEQG